MRIISTVLLFVAMLSLRATASPPSATPWADSMEKSWRAGEYDKVLQIAHDRLSKDPNDLPGLILVINYDLNYLDLTPLESSIGQALSVSATVKTPHFAALSSQFVFVLRAEKTLIKNYTPQDLERDRKKSEIKGKGLGFLEELQAMELDGLVK